MITLTLVFIFIIYSLNGGAAVYYAKVVLKNPNLVGPDESCSKYRTDRGNVLYRIYH